MKLTAAEISRCIKTQQQELSKVIDLSLDAPQIMFELGSGNLELVISAGIHGDELMPVRAMQNLKEKLANIELLRSGKVRFLVCNTPALRAGKRYLQSDLNDSFPGDEQASGELKLASQILPLVKNAPYVVDLHTGHEAPPFVVLPTLSYQKLLLAEQAGIDKIVLYENSETATTGPMVDQTPCGIGVETGPHFHTASIAVAEMVIVNYLLSMGFLSSEEETPARPEEISYFRIVDQLSLSEGKVLAESLAFAEFTGIPTSILPRNHGQDLLYPLLINPERTYEDVYAHLAIKLSREEMTALLT